MWLKWFPWRFVVRHVAKAHGFLDPIALLARLRRFSQPSEVHEPIELLRAGVVLDAGGSAPNISALMATTTGPIFGEFPVYMPPPVSPNLWVIIYDKELFCKRGR